LKLAGVLEALVAHGLEMNVSQTIQNWNRDHLINFSRNAIRIDWLKPVLPVFERILDRAW
jgi:hypothetical protein